MLVSRRRVFLSSIATPKKFRAERVVGYLGIFPLIVADEWHVFDLGDAGHVNWRSNPQFG
jgi:hypothetical protein